MPVSFRYRLVHSASCSMRRCRWLWRAALHEPWTPATHSQFPPAFRAAARTLLLVTHRGAAAAAAKQTGEAGPSTSAPPALPAGSQRAKQCGRGAARGPSTVSFGSHVGAMLLASLPPDVLPHAGSCGVPAVGMAALSA